MPRARTRGTITLELIIACAVLSFTLATITLALGGNDAHTFEREHDEYALAKNGLLDAVQAASITSTYTDVSFDRGMYSLATLIQSLTPCLTSVSVTATTSGEKGSGISFTEFIADTDASVALGGDCAAVPPAGDWTHVTPDGSASITGAAGTAIDVLDSYAYVGSTLAPYFHIVNSEGTLVDYDNGFTLGTFPNDIDAVRIGSKTYAFLAMNANTNQLAVVNVTDPKNSILLAAASLQGVDATGSFPQGWRLEYYDEKLYMVTRETKGNEFHIFDVSHPGAPTEYGSGKAIDITVNDLAIRDDGSKRYAYVAAARDSGELAVYDVTNSSAITEVSGSRTDLSGAQDGQSLALLGDTIYLGRSSVPTGADLYTFDVTNAAKPEEKGSADVGTGITSMRVLGDKAYLSTVKALKQVQVWDVSNVMDMTFLASYPRAGLAARGLDYDSDHLYVVGSSAPLFEILGD